ncbi:rhodanese-like domain-containing protein [Methanocrinis sp.]|uniref:rhodanese-like domain-containing protein n=1 Tax=Methanocrinis sp. TaxID=3101522 RepID=UPI003D0E0360
MKNKALLVLVLLGLFAVAGPAQAAEHEDMAEDGEMAEAEEMAEVDYMAKADAFMMGYPENSYYRMEMQELIDAVDAGDKNLAILDVRPAELYDSGHIPGSMNIPGPVLVTSIDMVPTDKKIATLCALDTNAAFAVSILRIFGDRDAWVVVGGPSAWEEAGRELVPSEEMSS